MRFIKRIILGCLLCFLCFFPIATRAASTASVSNVSLSPQPSGGMYINISVNYSSAVPLQLRMFAILYNAQGAVVDNASARLGGSSVQLPAATNVKNNKLPFFYSDASKLSLATKIAVTYDIIDPTANTQITAGTKSLVIPGGGGASLDVTKIAVEKTATNTIPVGFTLDYQSTVPLKLEMVLILYDDKGLIINPNVFRNGALKKDIPAAASKKTGLVVGATYTNAEEVAKAVRADVQWTITSVGNTTISREGTKKVSLTNSSTGGGGGGGGSVSTALSFVPGKVTGSVQAKDKAALSWQLTRVPASNETVHIKIYKGSDAALLYDGKVSAVSGETSFNFTGAKAGDQITAQLIDKKANKPLGESVKVTLAATSGSTNPSVPEPTPTSCTEEGATFVNGVFCETLFGEQVTAGQYFLRAYYWAVAVAILGAAVAIVFAGYKYAMSRGNPSEISTAKEIIISALVGLALLLLSFVILRFLGINVATPDPASTSNVAGQTQPSLPGTGSNGSSSGGSGTSGNTGGGTGASSTTKTKVKVTNVTATRETNNRLLVEYTVDYTSSSPLLINTSGTVHSNGTPKPVLFTLHTLPAAASGTKGQKVSLRYDNPEKIDTAEIDWTIMDTATSQQVASGRKIITADGGNGGLLHTITDFMGNLFKKSGPVTGG